MAISSPAVIETSMLKLKTASDDGCELCELAFKCVAAHEATDGTPLHDILDQGVSLSLRILSERESTGSTDGKIRDRSTRHVSMYPTILPQLHNTQAMGASASLSLSLYTRTYESPEFCVLSSRGTKIAVKLDRSPRNIASSPKSEQCFRIVDKWLKTCLAAHPLCSERPGSLDPGMANERVPLPTRVLDVGSELGGEMVRLVESKGLEGAYAALSHCVSRFDSSSTLSTALIFSSFYCCCRDFCIIPHIFDSASADESSVGWRIRP